MDGAALAAVPSIPLGSIGWRMGAGETYWYQFQDWFGAQPESLRKAIISAFPEPPGTRWDGFYERTRLACTARHPQPAP